MKTVEKLFQCLLLLLVFVMPSQWGSPFPPIGKPILFVTFGDLILGAALLVWFVLVLMKRNWREVRWPPLSFLCFSIVVIVSCVWAEKKMLALKEAIQAVEFFVVASFLFLNGFKTPKDWRRALAVFGASTFCILLLALKQYFTAGNAYDIAGTFGNKNVLAVFLALALPLFFGVALLEKGKAYRLGLLLIIPGLLLALSGAVVASLAVVILLLMSLRCRWGAAGLTLICAALFAVTPWLPLRGGHREILFSSVAPFVRSNYAFSPAAAKQQAQVAFNEASYDTARNFLSVYENMYPDHPELRDTALLAEPDLSDWEEFCTQIMGEIDNGGVSQKLWGQFSPELRQAIQAALEKLERKPDWDLKLKGQFRKEVVRLLNEAAKKNDYFTDEEVQAAGADEKLMALAQSRADDSAESKAAMRNRVILASLYPGGVALPIRIRLEWAINEANKYTKSDQEEAAASLDSISLLSKDDPSDAESVLIDIVDEYRDRMEDQFLSFQLTEQPDPVPNTRYIRWHAAWRLIRTGNRAGGLLGAGPGHFRKAVNLNYDVGGPLRKPSIEGRAGAPDTWGLSTDEPDSFNQYLVYGAELGFLGLFTFVWILAGGLAASIRAIRKPDGAFIGLAYGTFGALCAAMPVAVFHPVVVRGLGLPLVFILCASHFLAQAEPVSELEHESTENSGRGG